MEICEGGRNRSCFTSRDLYCSHCFTFGQAAVWPLDNQGRTGPAQDQDETRKGLQRTGTWLGRAEEYWVKLGREYLMHGKGLTGNSHCSNYNEKFCFGYWLWIFYQISFVNSLERLVTKSSKRWEIHCWRIMSEFWVILFIFMHYILSWVFESLSLMVCVFKMFLFQSCPPLPNQ